MKIKEVKVYLLKKKLTASMTISRGGFTERNHAIVQVIAEDGSYGLGEGIGNALMVKVLIENVLANKVIGENIFDISKIKNKLINDYVYFERKGSVICAASAIETALYDLQGKIKKVPVYELLGGKIRNEIEAYVSDIYWEKDISKMGDCAKRIVDSGFNIIKAHIGHGTPEEDTKRVEVIRKAVGDKIKFMIDLNCGYSIEDALKAAKLWAPYNIYWLEEPVHPDEIKGMAKIKKESKIPIAAGENEFLINGFNDLFENDAIDFAMPDIGRAGGMLETKKICENAAKFGVTPSIHNFSSGVLLSATLQVIAATKECSLLEYDSSANAVYHEFFIEPLKIKDGIVQIQDLPGLGVELKKEILEKYAV